MFQLDREDIIRSSRIFLDKPNHSVLDLLNDVLVEKADLERFVIENGLDNYSSGQPGLIVQVYLIMVQLFDLNMTGPIGNLKVKSYERISNTEVTDEPPAKKAKPPETDDFIVSNCKCEICAKVFKSKSSLKKHKVVHRPKKETSEELPCQLCDDVFKNFKDRVHHRRDKHQEMFDNDKLGVLLKSSLSHLHDV